MVVYQSSRCVIRSCACESDRSKPEPSSPELYGHEDKDTEGRGKRDNSTRGRILTSAERLFAEQGYNGVSMPMIASASGVTAGAIYKHFDSKADLFFEVIQRAVQSTPVPAGTGDASDATLLPHVVAMYSMRNLKLLRQLAVEVHSASVKDPRVRRLLRRSVDLRIEQIRDSIAAAQQADIFRPSRRLRVAGVGSNGVHGGDDAHGDHCAEARWRHEMAGIRSGSSRDNDGHR